MVEIRVLVEVRVTVEVGAVKDMMPDTLQDWLQEMVEEMLRRVRRLVLGRNRCMQGRDWVMVLGVLDWIISELEFRVRELRA